MFPDIYRQPQAVPAIARTANISGSTYEFNLSQYKACTLEGDLDSITGTSVTVTLEGYNPATEDWYTLLSTAAISAAGQFALTINPDGVAATNSVLARCVPERVRVVTTGTWTAAVFGCALNAWR